MKKIIFLSLLLALLVSGCSAPLIKIGQNGEKILSPEEAKAAAEKFINENLLPANIKATVKRAVLEGEVYNISLTVNGKDYASYMTKDGKKFFQSGIDMAKLAEENAVKPAVAGEQVQNQNAAVTKTDKPKVELFVMTHCPYGLQAEKGLLPAIEALGGKIDAKIRFVHYFMHGDKEEQETYSQLCFREEQAAKYYKYLSCFIAGGDSVKCLGQAGIDKAKLNNCLGVKAKDYYKTDSELSQSYGVSGSPTLVINGAQSDSGRDSASYLASICAAFKNRPVECDKQLSAASPSAGFGGGTDSGSSGGGCGQ
jgi:protein-disulfide isomerase